MNALSLFNEEIEDLAIAIEDFEKINSFEELYNNLRKFKVEYFDILNNFFKKEPNCIIPDYFVDCQYNEVSNNYRMRFVILKSDEDYFLIPLKIVDPIDKSKSSRYFIVSHNIIALNGSKTDYAYDLVKKIISSAIISTDSILNISNVVFYNTVDSFNCLNTSKWRSKNGINILGKIIITEYYDKIPKDILYLILELNDKWSLQKNKRTPNKIIKDFCTKESNKCIVYFFEDKVVGFQLVTFGYKNIATCHISKSYTLDLGNKKVNDYLGAYMIYQLHLLCFNKFGANIVNYLGVRDIKKISKFI